MKISPNKILTQMLSESIAEDLQNQILDFERECWGLTKQKNNMFTGEFIIKEIQPNNTYKVNIKEDSEYVEFEIDKRYIVRPTKNPSLKDTTYEVFLAGERYPRYVTQKYMRKLFEYVKDKEHLTMEWKHDKTRA